MEEKLKNLEDGIAAGNRRELWRLFPKDIQFLYLLVLSRRQCGNTGKAVKNAELLVQKEPDNKWFYRELAVSYMEQGFAQKAYRACEKAYRLGCRDMEYDHRRRKHNLRRDVG